MDPAAIKSSGDSRFRISARIERLPISAWHTRVRLIVGFVWFFDAFDALAIAYVLPVLVGLWKLSPSEIAGLISAGFAGQAVGSVLFGYLSERIGRIPAIVWTMLLFASMGVLCALCWNFPTLASVRFAQGIGLGGAVPVMLSYMNEIAKAERRGSFILVYQLPFPIGLTAVALAGVWVVPHLGWQWMFVIGAVPAFAIVALRRMLLESPRWLASRSRFEEADAVMTRIEQLVSAHEKRPLPPIADEVPVVVPASTRLSDLFKGIYARRTFTAWALYFTTYLVVYGLASWMPTLYRTVYKLSVHQALTFSFLTTIAALAGSVMVAFLIDRTGRRPWIGTALILGAIPLFMLHEGATLAPELVLLLVSLSTLCINSVALPLGMFIAESYPTHLRALGGGVAAAWLRLAAVVGPYVVSTVLPLGIGAVFATFGASGLVGGLVCLIFAVETRGKILEAVSPAH